MKINVGVIGIGTMGKNHMRILSEMENVNFVCVADSNNEILNKCENKYSVKTYLDYKEMISNEKLDMVSIVVPTHLHLQVALDCINANINVLLEKPIAANVVEGKQLLQAALEKKVLLTIGHVERFNPALLELRKRIKAGETGTIYKIEADRHGPYPMGRIKDSGVVIDLAVHDLDIFRWLLGAEVTQVYSETAKKIHTTNEDLLLVLLKFNNGVLGKLDVNWLTPVKKRKLRILGEKGMFEIDYISQDLYYYENSSKMNKFSTESNTPFTISEGSIIKYFVEKKEPLRLEIKHFIDCVINNKEPVVSGLDGLKAIELAEKIIESADKNMVIKIE